MPHPSRWLVTVNFLFDSIICYGEGMAGQRDDLGPVWARMMSLFKDRRDAMFGLLTQHGLTPPHAHAIHVLQHGPTRMRDLAEQMTCDASYITAIVDKLEERGLAERRPGATDRRVKEIALTPAGVALAAEVADVMTAAPAEFDRLTRAERATLAALLAKVVPDPVSDPMAFPARR